jgi:hypothetical protein
MPTPTKAAPKKDELADTIREAVTQALAEREEQKAAEDRLKVSKTQGSSVLLAIVLVMFAGSCIYNLVEMRALSRPIDLTVEQRIEAVDAHLYTVRARIEAYCETQRRYPASLSVLDMPADANLTYALISSNEYALEYCIGDVVRSYNSKEPPDRLLAGEFARAAFRRSGSGLID